MTEFSSAGVNAGGPRSGPRAGFGIRLVAILIDAVVLTVVGFVIRVILGNSIGGLIDLVAGIAYYIYLEGSPSGQTVGKKLMNIRVIDFNGGGAIGYSRAALRYVGRIPSTIVCLLGYFWMLWDSEKQTWHDKIATTVVVPTADYPVAAWPG